MRFDIGVVALTFAFCASGSAVWAQGAAGNGPCASLPGVTPERAVQFLDQPGALIEQNRDVVGGLAMAVRDLAMGRPESIPGMVTLANLAGPDQLRAIGAGLGTAAAVCSLSQPGTAQRIQEAVLQTNKPEIVMAFTSIVGDVPTEAIPELPPTGETTPGGGPNVRTTAQAGGGALPTPQSNSLFGTLAAANQQSTIGFLAVSPSN